MVSTRRASTRRNEKKRRGKRKTSSACCDFISLGTALLLKASHVFRRFSQSSILARCILQSAYSFLRIQCTTAIPVAEKVEHDSSNAKVMGSIYPECRASHFGSKQYVCKYNANSIMLHWCHMISLRWMWLILMEGQVMCIALRDTVLHTVCAGCVLHIWAKHACNSQILPTAEMHLVNVSKFHN